MTEQPNINTQKQFFNDLIQKYPPTTNKNVFMEKFQQHSENRIEENSKEIIDDQYFPKIHQQRIQKQKTKMLEIQIKKSEKDFTRKLSEQTKVVQNKLIYKPTYQVLTRDNYKNYQYFQYQKIKPEDIQNKMKQLFKRKKILDQNFSPKNLKFKHANSVNNIFQNHSIEKILASNYNLNSTNDHFDSKFEKINTISQNDDSNIEYMLSKKRSVLLESIQIKQQQVKRGINLDNEKIIESDVQRIVLENNINFIKNIKKLKQYLPLNNKINYENIERKNQQQLFDNKSSIEQFQYLIQITEKILNSNNTNNNITKSDIETDEQYTQEIEQTNNNNNNNETEKKKNIQKDFIFLIGLKEFFSYFKKEQLEIVNRILLGLDINPYNDLSKVYWHQYNIFKRILIEQTANLGEKIDFVVSFILGCKLSRDQIIELDQILRIVKLLLRKLTDDPNSLQFVNLISNNIQLSQMLNNNNTITVQNLKDLFLQKYLMVDDFILLFQI